MGNAHPPDGADHDYYRRPADGVEPERSMQMPSVQIVDDGAGGHTGAGAGTGHASSGETAARGHAKRSAEEAPSTPVPFWKRFNLALAAAWALVGVFLAIGLWWLTSSFPTPQSYYDPSGNQSVETSSQIAMNLYGLGSFLFLIGILGAFTLLVVQSARFRRPGR